MHILYSVVGLSGVTLLCLAVFRWRQVGKFHPEYVVRRDMVLLVLLFIVGIGGDALRTYPPPGNRDITVLLISIALAPVGIAAVLLLVRLIAAYRRLREEEIATRGARSNMGERRE